MNIDTNHVYITKNATSGIAQITVDESGQNQIVVVGGANEKLNVDDVQCAADVVSQATVLVCQLETSVNVALKAIEICKGVSKLRIVISELPCSTVCPTEGRMVTSKTIEI